ncbi:MAG: COX15/CtaA family protein [Candidatus Eisenbacteria bacterium]|uniref:COX15/CtaA family protein n=1 Tax=Eiseniibacteriota bacterium TaxID=2212470 RepID=A0A9D6L951_UNCEI|nr:COX15/CtaA family protein [Candidatus Eisenbacteria bacterium]MBI3539177.1 COX15/CtaA family protein [Candidatus Eisenbacteria bacterium]
MAPRRPFAFAAGLGLATTLLTFTLIVVGSVVRSTGSGLACPDWPLCQGRLIPPLQMNVLIEWTHRLIALLVSLAVLALAATTMISRTLRVRFGALAGLAVLLLVAQVLLGALTVWKLLDPSIVSGHLAVAMLLFCTLLTYTMRAGAGDAGSDAGDAESAAGSDDARGALTPPRPAGLLPLAAVATVMTYAQALLGGMVSTHHAGLVCPEWPTCNGAWFPPLDGLVGLQMMHRYGAYALTAMMLVLATATRTAPDAAIRACGRLALTLVVAQVLLGVSNVFLGTPVWLSAAHLATAIALLAIVLATTVRVASLPARAPAHAAPGAPIGGAAA